MRELTVSLSKKLLLMHLWLRTTNQNYTKHTTSNNSLAKHTSSLSCFQVVVIGASVRPSLAEGSLLAAVSIVSGPVVSTSGSDAGG